MDAKKYKCFNSVGVAHCNLNFDTPVTVNQEIKFGHKVTRHNTQLTIDQTRMVSVIIC